MRRTTAALSLFSMLLFFPPLARAAGPEYAAGSGKRLEPPMSAMGYLAAGQARARAWEYLRSLGLPLPDLESYEGEPAGPAGGQAELAIAVDVTGQHVVVGFNDTRGFDLNPISVSGFAYSDDGGVTFTDGGQLPAPSNGQLANGTKLPQVFGDPDVKYVPGGAGCQFIYSSILVTGFSGAAPNFTGTAQTMGIHRSTDCGHTWTGPFEVPPATNPNGLLSGLNARDAADKEFIDVDPETGRVLMSWSNFTPVAPGGVEISATFSDDIMTATPPTWAARRVVAATAADGQASVPRFAGQGSANAYVAWRRTFLANIAFARSTDNGATWSAPVNLTANFFTMDQVLGNDRVNTSPSMDVDKSGGPNSGNIYVAYANNNSRDGADIAFQRSTDGGLTFSPAALLNSRPGSDRAQWFPQITVDRDTGRVSVIYYDQGIATSGDLTEMTWIFSDDAGVTWSAPSPLTDRPFHAGYGNDTGQPNLGDYNGATAQNGILYAAFAGNPPFVGFDDGQPDTKFTVPDVQVVQATTAKAGLSLASVAFSESGGNGFVDAGDQLRFTLPLRNYVTNPGAGAVTYTGVGGTLSTTTPGVTILRATAAYPSIGPGLTQSNGLPYVVQLAPNFVPGTKIEFSLAVTTGQGSTTLPFTRNTGTPVPTTIFAESFDGVAPGALPAGWVRSHAGGNNIVPWTTSNTFCGTTSNGLFHINANDGLNNNHTRFERAFSPNIVVPANAEYVTLDFDICYDLEDDPNFNVQAFDGATLRITDITAGRTLRSVLTEAFAELITTGNVFHFPKHLPRSNDPNYFEDMSVWSGDSQGFKHVSMRLPGMKGSTVQFRFEYTQDNVLTCANVRPGHSCGVIIDNIVMKSVVSKSDELLKVTLKPVPGMTGKWTGAVTSQAVAAGAGIPVALSGIYSTGPVTITPGDVTIPAGSQTSPSFTVSVTGPGTGAVTATGPSNSRSAGIKVQ